MYYFISEVKTECTLVALLILLFISLTPGVMQSRPRKNKINMVNAEDLQSQLLIRLIIIEQSALVHGVILWVHRMAISLP